jgi:hypothetical protein
MKRNHNVTRPALGRVTPEDKMRPAER